MFNAGMQSFDAGPGGPAISGKWINRQNGKTVNVRDSIIEGDNMIVITDSGNINMTEFSRNYVQASENIYDEHGRIIGTEAIDPSELLYNKKKPQKAKPTKSAPKATQKSEVNVFAEDLEQSNFYDSDILVDDAALIFGNKQNQNQPEPATVKKSSDPKIEVIGKIFDKIDTKPRIDIKLHWAEFPSEDIQVLGKYFDITTEDIARYLCDRYITRDEIASAVEDFLMNN